jgi:hypothetical protein
VLSATGLEVNPSKLEKLVNCSELEEMSLPQSKSRETVGVYRGEQTKFLTRISWKKVRKIGESLRVGRNF